jgi:signal transduction histidine kinase/CheY-like chemotaxis protein
MACLTGSAALIGWFIKSQRFTGIRPDYIPMAPNTALVFIGLGLSLAALAGINQTRRVVVFIRSSAALVLFLTLLRLCEYTAGVDFGLDDWARRFPGESFSLAPVGKMAFFTAVNFVFATAALIIISFPDRGRFANDLAKSLATIVTFVGIAFSLSYLYGAPLFYGSKHIPMALNTSVAFLVLGVGLFIAASMRDVAERQTSRARLQEYQGELERQVAERTSELVQANEELAERMAERDELQQQLLQAQKMEAVGRLAGGVAHDFNNLLTAIIGYSQLLLRRFSADDPVFQELEEIRKAGERAATLTRQLLAFSRKQVLQPKVLDLNAVVADTSKMLSRLIGEDIKLRTVLDPRLKPVQADPGQVEQVLMNLAVNARDAMPGGGSLTIETANVVLGEEYSSHHVGVQPGEYVLIAVSDTGVGMDAATQARMFEPFFTTKEQGKGTGLGLAMVYGIIKQSGGHIWVYSEPGRGTTVKIYLSQVSESAETWGQMAQPSLLPGGTETVLLAEDDAQVGSFAARVLRELGYMVIEARNGKEALQVAVETGQNIDLLLTDVVMPEMGGKTLADWLKLHRPEVRVLFISGYTEDAIVQHGVLDAGVSFLHKPFTPGELARKVREVIDAPVQEELACNG